MDATLKATLQARRVSLLAALGRAESFQAEYDHERDQMEVQLRLAHIEEASSKLEDIQQQLEDDETDDAASSTLSGIKLPTITLPEFDGDYQKWLAFHDLFVALIHNNPDLPDVQKFHYLRGVVVGKAAGYIDTYDINAANYQIAWDTLVERYNNEYLLKKRHLQALFELPPMEHETASSLHSLVDEFQRHIKILDQLKEPTASWSTVLEHLLCTRLHVDTINLWEDHASTLSNPDFQSLIEFLQRRMRVLESISVNNNHSSSNGATSSHQSPRPASKKRSSQRLSTYASTASSGPAADCAACGLAHPLYKCHKFGQLSVPERQRIVSNKHLCYNCLGAHQVRNCSSKRSCRHCQQRHHSLLHAGHADNSPRTNSGATAPTQASGQLEVSASVVSTKQEVATPTEVVPQVEVSVPLQQPKENVFLLTVLIKVVDSLGMEHVARALLDSASQPNLITDRMARILRLKRAPASVVIQGAGQMSTPVRHSVSTEVRSRKSDFSCGINFLVMDKLTAELPSHNISTSGWNIPVELFLADPTFNERQPIDMVLGAKHFHSFFPSAARIHLDGSLPILVDSVFGWIVTGSASQASSTPTETAHSYSVLAMMSLEESMERFWKTEELTINDKLSVEERDCESLFQSTTTRTPEGRYVVRYPRKPGFENLLGDSKTAALRRFRLLERRLERDAQLKEDYHKFMREYVELGHMQLVEPDEKDKTPSCYLPHHPVFKDSSTTTKVRVVFDGSAATSTGFSLNQALCVGPVVQEDLLSLLLRFRNYPVALVADAAKMYRQVLVHPEDRRLQRIFWRFSPDSPIQTYELQTVTYGLAPSAYLATRSLQQLAQDEGHEYPLGGPALESNFYVDDFIGGADTVEDAIRLRKELTELLAKGGFEMRKWTSNRLEVLRGLTQDQIGTQSSLQFGPNEMVKALGIGWEPEADVLRFDSQINQSKGPPTKQFILSTIARLYDPLGHIAPVVVTAKIIMQECWQLKCDWNDPVPDNIRIKWEKFFKELPEIRSYRIDRYALQPDSTYQLHTFCDASKDAYGACCYIRCEDRHGNVRVTFLASKSRVAPLRGLNVPRLEANAAVLGVHLHFRIKQALKIKISDSYFWTDSAVVLQWIQANPNTWKTYVANRVAEIQFYTRGCHWNHVPTKDNPADLVSRGMTVPNFLNCETWKNATSWICSNPRDWPRTNPPSVPADIMEARVVAAVTEKPPQVHPWFLRWHSYRRLVHSIGFVLRFIDNTRQKARTTRTSDTPVRRALTVEQFAKAKTVLTRLAQQDSFSTELKELEKGKPVPKQSNIYKMSPFIDAERVLRVGGRLKLSQLPFQAKHPALLPGSHPFARILAEFYHQKLFHGGGRLLLTAMREEFWPIGGRILARSVVRNCFRCVRLNPELVQQQIGQLPAQRIIPSRPFSVVGVDYAGPLYLKPIHKRAAPAKAYICLFVCFATKAVHIELVGDLSTPAFLAALRRFIGRRGVPSHIHSDNGKNFEGAKNELARLYTMLTHDAEQEKIHEFCTAEGITWHLTPPKAPHFGGLWESAVKVAKKHLFRQLGPSRLSFEDMCTVLTQIESHMNSRPLLPLSEDPNDLAALTPAHFLIGTSMHALPDPDLRHIPVNRLDHYQQLQLHAQQFWAHWRREYLQELLRDTKGYQRNDEIQPGRLVIVVDELQGPLRWPLARIEAVHPGPDGIVRVVSLRTASGGIITRPAVKICLLPVPQSPEAPHTTPQPGQLSTDAVFPEEEKH
ncbi:uncharacterized protein LOC120423264 [Culex pipiens pallens]|uniref:uncharacterized protein LOC120423264 n=1 Tax=Culex pipiens pallens TaxID=42434 RepID=UPI0019542797|nr:uncharacterized protein LOC120423264 [Culex pipiens pallens]